MFSRPSACSGLFVCTAILCWDYSNLKYSFFNLTQCTPTALDVQINYHLIPANNQFTKSLDKLATNGFICSNCTRENLRRLNSNQSKHCHQQATRIKLENYCHSPSFFRRNASACQCSRSNQFIQPITNWVMALDKSGKSDINIHRVNKINQSASYSVYILVGFILCLVLVGGLIGMIFYCLKLKISPERTSK